LFVAVKSPLRPAKTWVLLRGALSSQNTPFAKLMRSGQTNLPVDVDPVLPQVNAVDPRRYRMNRKLSPAERAEMVEQYRRGTSALELARKYGTHRHTIARQLEEVGVVTRPQTKMTPRLSTKRSSSVAYISGAEYVIDGAAREAFDVEPQ
jgi:hypothetical protein